MKHGKYSKLAKEKNTFPKVIVGTQKLIKQRKEIMGELKKVVPSEHKNEILLYYKSLIASHSGDEGVLIDKQNKITDLLKSNLLENPNELSIREKITILKVASKENSYKHHSSLKEFSDFRNDLMHYEEILKGHLQNTQAKGESQK